MRETLLRLRCTRVDMVMGAHFSGAAEIAIAVIGAGLSPDRSMRWRIDTNTRLLKRLKRQWVEWVRSQWDGVPVGGQQQPPVHPGERPHRTAHPSSN